MRTRKRVLSFSWHPRKISFLKRYNLRSGHHEIFKTWVPLEISQWIGPIDVWVQSIWRPNKDFSFWGTYIYYDFVENHISQSNHRIFEINIPLKNSQQVDHDGMKISMSWRPEKNIWIFLGSTIKKTCISIQTLGFQNPYTVGNHYVGEIRVKIRRGEIHSKIGPTMMQLFVKYAHWWIIILQI